MHTKQSTILLNKNNGFSTAAAENAKKYTHTDTHTLETKQITSKTYGLTVGNTEREIERDTHMQRDAHCTYLALCFTKQSKITKFIDFMIE